MQKGYGFLSSTMDALKTSAKRAIQKRAEATRDLIGNKTADKITSLKNFTIVQKQL